MTSDRLPARLIPLLYLGAAHLSLALAASLAGLWPRAVAGFFYHSWMVAIVHLVTLGWITFSILGSIYIVAPLALRMPMPARRADYWGFGFALVGLVGMLGHFWIEEYAGMAWSAATAAIGVLYGASRIAGGLRHAKIQVSVKLHLAFASVNIALAATMGLLLGFDKAYHFLPGFVLSNVFAHAHLAAIGWATTMVVGTGYRLLPMILPSKMPDDPWMTVGAVVLEAGVLGLFASLLLRSVWSVAAGALILAGLAIFAAHVVWMLRSPVPRPIDAPRIDFAVLHAAGAGVSLAAAAAIGIALLIREPSAAMLRAGAAYGVLGLVGFLSQMVVAMQTRLLPMAAWFWMYSETGFRVPPPPPNRMRDRALQTIVFSGWTAGVPSLAAGLFFESSTLVAVGAWSLLAAVLVMAIDSLGVVSRVAAAGRAASAAPQNPTLHANPTS
jgi:hypothetical protein